MQPEVTQHMKLGTLLECQQTCIRRPTSLGKLLFAEQELQSDPSFRDDWLPGPEHSGLLEELSHRLMYVETSGKHPTSKLCCLQCGSTRAFVRDDHGYACSDLLAICSRVQIDAGSSYG